MKIFIVLFSSLLVLLTVSACYYDSEEYLYPQLGNQCDTSNVTFTASVKPILQNSCYGCHSNSTSSFGGNIRLENYTDVMVRVSDGSLIGSITHAGGFSPMPVGASKIEDCKISVIKKWIELNSPNN